MYASYWLVARQVPSSMGFWCAFSILCVIIVKTPAKRNRIISLEKPHKGFRPQKAYFSIPDSARPPLGTGMLRFLVLACLLACLIHFPFLAREKKDIRLGPQIAYRNRWMICEVFSCDQAALWMVQSVRLSVRPSVCLSVTPFWLCSHHPIIMKFSWVITSDKSDVRAKGQGQRSKVKVTEVTTQLNRFRTVTPVWIHIWGWNDAYSLMLLRKGALLFFKVIHQISRSHGSKNRQIWPRLGVSGL